MKSFSVLATESDTRRATAGKTRATLALLDEHAALDESDIDISSDQRGAGYGEPTEYGRAGGIGSPANPTRSPPDTGQARCRSTLCQSSSSGNGVRLSHNAFVRGQGHAGSLDGKPKWQFMK